MAETTDIAPEEETDAPSEDTTESAPAVDAPTRPVNIVPAAATGRRRLLARDGGRCRVGRAAEPS